MDTVGVWVGCPCEGTPHPDGDTVYLRARLGLAAGTAVQSLVIEAKQTAGVAGADLLGSLAEAYLLHGVVSWTFVNPLGEPIPVTPDTIRSQLLDDFERGEAVASRADDLYLGPVVLPLLREASPSSPLTPTDGSTSQPIDPESSSRPEQTPSERSSTTTSQTVDTVTITAPLDGASSSSPS